MVAVLSEFEVYLGILVSSREAFATATPGSAGGGTGVRGVRGYASAGCGCGLLAPDLGTDVTISFVSTVPEARRRGLTGAVLATARRMPRSAPADSWPAGRAESRCARVGFVPPGRWQEWVRGDRAGRLDVGG